MGIQQYSTEFDVGSSSPTTITPIMLPWEANQLLIINDGAIPVYLRLGSSAATTDDFPIKQTESLEFNERYISKLALASTTTCTDSLVRVGAWRA